MIILIVFSTLKKSLNNRLKSNDFDIEPISAFDVKRSLQSLNPNKSTGMDGIGPKILKISGDSIVTPITFIINKINVFRYFGRHISRCF